MNNRRHIIRTFLSAIPAALLLALYGCNDVPLDTATFRSDTLSEPVFVGTEPTDTLPASFTATRPEITWRTMSLGYQREDPSNPGRPRRETISCSATEESIVELTNVITGPGQGEYLTLELTCVVPRRVRDSSVASGSDMRTYLKQFEIVIPRVRVPAGSGSWDVDLESAPYETEDPGASVLLARAINGRYHFSTGDPGSKGEFRVKSIDRRRRVIFAHVELEFKLTQSGPGRVLPLDMEMALSY